MKQLQSLMIKKITHMSHNDNYNYFNDKDDNDKRNNDSY